MRIADEPSSENAPGTHRRPELPLFEPPRLHAREREPRRTTWLELFFDLVFVVGVDQVARRLSGEVTAGEVLGFAVLYVPVWWAWVGLVTYADRFGTDDLGDRLLTLAQMGAVIVLSVRAHDALESGGAAFAVAYGVFRLILSVRYAIAAHFIPEARGFARREAAGFAIVAALWLVSAALDPPVRYVLWGMGVLADLGTPLLARDAHRVAPPDPRHLEERFGNFVNIVLGVGFVTLVEDLHDLDWTPPALACAALVLLTGFALWWAYFETLDQAPVTELREHRRQVPYKLWVYGHLPFAMGIAAAGVAVGDAIRYATLPALPGSGRWLIAGALALCFAAQAVLDTAYALSGGGTESRVLALRHAVMATLALAVAALGEGASSVEVMALLALITVSHLAIDLWRRAHARAIVPGDAVRAGGPAVGRRA